MRAVKELILFRIIRQCYLFTVKERDNYFISLCSKSPGIDAVILADAYIRLESRSSNYFSFFDCFDRRDRDLKFLRGIYAVICNSDISGAFAVPCPFAVDLIIIELRIYSICICSAFSVIFFSYESICIIIAPVILVQLTCIYRGFLSVLHIPAVGFFVVHFPLFRAHFYGNSVSFEFLPGFVNFVVFIITRIKIADSFIVIISASLEISSDMVI